MCPIVADVLHFGQLFEAYGRDVMTRIRDQNLRRRSLIWEDDYQSPGEKTTDGLLLETVGQHNKCTLLEFTVGRYGVAG